MQGFGRFAGPEGLRGLCHPKSIVEDRWFGLSIPAQIQYPSSGVGFSFGSGLVRLMYGHSVAVRLAGLWELVKSSV